jgi:SAM-dependent methyltransferase
MRPVQPSHSYEHVAREYRRFRRPDPRIAAAIHHALGDARSVVNVGAGTGSYEPTDRRVVAVDPSAAMVAQRPAGSATAVRATAQALPFRTAAFDAGLALLTIHHWPDWRVGIAELARVARDRVVVFTWDPGADDFWLVRDYLPRLHARDRSVFPSIATLTAMLASTHPVLDVIDVAIPGDCTDGFLGAYWRRPEMYLDEGARRAISALSSDAPEIAEALERLRRELADGTWAVRHGALLARRELDIGYRLVVARR